MPWSLQILDLLTVLVVLFFAGFGWAAGVWLFGRIIAALTRNPSAQRP